MKAVGYTQSGPIDRADSLIDLELPLPIPGARVLRWRGAKFIGDWWRRRRGFDFDSICFFRHHIYRLGQLTSDQFSFTK